MTWASTRLSDVILSCCSLLLAGTVFAQTPAVPEASQDSGLRRIFAAGLDSLRFVFTGIGSLGGGTESMTGAVWYVDIRSGESRRIGNAADFAWPVLSPDGLAVFALRDGQVVRISIGDDKETLIGDRAGWRKLLGVTPDGTVLGFVEDDPRPRPALLKPNGRRVELPPPVDEDERKRNGLLLQEVRDYADDIGLEVHDSERGGRGRDVVLIDHAKQRNLSDCGDDICAQPSRSHDGRSVLYIRSSRL